MARPPPLGPTPPAALSFMLGNLRRLGRHEFMRGRRMLCAVRRAGPGALACHMPYLPCSVEHSGGFEQGLRSRARGMAARCGDASWLGAPRNPAPATMVSPTHVDAAVII